MSILRVDIATFCAAVSQAVKTLEKSGWQAPLLAVGKHHSLRHAHASYALDRGAPIHLVQATLGHSSVATTGRYLHARPGDSSARFLALERFPESRGIDLLVSRAGVMNVLTAAAAEG